MLRPCITLRPGLVFLCVILVTATAVAQSVTVDDPIVAAQTRAAQRASSGSKIITAGAIGAFNDPIYAAQVSALAEKTFPNLAAELETAELLQKAASDPSMRGNFRGRIAEDDWVKRNAKDGWRPVKGRNAPQNDAYRYVNGKIEGAQIKVHADWHDYIRSMRKDNKAERFVLPDDHYSLVYDELEKRRLGAIKGGLTEKADYYAAQQRRLTKIGRTFDEYEDAIKQTAKHYSKIAKAIRAGGKAASFIGIAMGILDSSIAVYEVAVGKAEVSELVTRVGKTIIGGASAWAIGGLAAKAAATAGASGAVPVAVAIIVGTATYLVVDWAIDATADSLKGGYLSAMDVSLLWPEGARGIPLDRLYRKPPDPAALIR